MAQAAPAFADDHLAGLALRGQPAALAVLAQRRLGGLSGLRPAQRETLLATLYPIDPAVVQDVD